MTTANHPVGGTPRDPQRTGEVRPQEPAAERRVLEEAEERLHVERRVRETGRVQVRRRTAEREVEVDEPMIHERVEVERVPVGRFVDAPVDVRREGDVTIIPVFEEVLVKRLRLVEEVRIRHLEESRSEPRRETLRHSTVEIERLGEARQNSP